MNDTHIHAHAHIQAYQNNCDSEIKSLAEYLSRSHISVTITLINLV